MFDNSHQFFDGEYLPAVSPSRLAQTAQQRYPARRVFVASDIRTDEYYASAAVQQRRLLARDNQHRTSSSSDLAAFWESVLHDQPISLEEHESAMATHQVQLTAVLQRLLKQHHDAARLAAARHHEQQVKREVVEAAEAQRAAQQASKIAKSSLVTPHRVPDDHASTAESPANTCVPHGVDGGGIGPFTSQPPSRADRTSSSRGTADSRSRGGGLEQTASRLVSAAKPFIRVQPRPGMKPAGTDSKSVASRGAKVTEGKKPSMSDDELRDFLTAMESAIDRSGHRGDATTTTATHLAAAADAAARPQDRPSAQPTAVGHRGDVSPLLSPSEGAVAAAEAASIRYQHNPPPHPEDDDGHLAAATASKHSVSGLPSSQGPRTANGPTLASPMERLPASVTVHSPQSSGDHHQEITPRRPVANSSADPSSPAHPSARRAADATQHQGTSLGSLPSPIRPPAQPTVTLPGAIKAAGPPSPPFAAPHDTSHDASQPTAANRLPVVPAPQVAASGGHALSALPAVWPLVAAAGSPPASSYPHLTTAAAAPSVSGTSVHRTATVSGALPPLAGVASSPHHQRRPDPAAEAAPGTALPGGTSRADPPTRLPTRAAEVEVATGLGELPPNGARPTDSRRVAAEATKEGHPARSATAAATTTNSGGAKRGDLAMSLPPAAAAATATASPLVPSAVHAGTAVETAHTAPFAAGGPPTALQTGPAHHMSGKPKLHVASSPSTVATALAPVGKDGGNGAVRLLPVPIAPPPATKQPQPASLPPQRPNANAPPHPGSSGGVVHRSQEGGRHEPTASHPAGVMGAIIAGEATSSTPKANRRGGQRHPPQGQDAIASDAASPHRSAASVAAPGVALEGPVPTLDLRVVAPLLSTDNGGAVAPATHAGGGTMEPLDRAATNELREAAAPSANFSPRHAVLHVMHHHVASTAPLATPSHAAKLAAAQMFEPPNPKNATADEIVQINETKAKIRRRGGVLIQDYQSDVHCVANVKKDVEFNLSKIKALLLQEKLKREEAARKAAGSSTTVDEDDKPPEAEDSVNNDSFFGAPSSPSKMSSSSAASWGNDVLELVEQLGLAETMLGDVSVALRQEASTQTQILASRKAAMDRLRMRIRDQLSTFRQNISAVSSRLEQGREERVALAQKYIVWRRRKEFGDEAIAERFEDELNAGERSREIGIQSVIELDTLPAQLERLVGVMQREGEIHAAIRSIFLSIRDVLDMQKAAEIELTCPVCDELMSDAVVLTPCGHCFCASCAATMKVAESGNSGTAGAAHCCLTCGAVGSEGSAPNRALHDLVSRWEFRGTGSVDILDSLRQLDEVVKRYNRKEVERILVTLSRLLPLAA